MKGNTGKQRCPPVHFHPNSNKKGLPPPPTPRPSQSPPLSCFLVRSPAPPPVLYIVPTTTDGQARGVYTARFRFFLHIISCQSSSVIGTRTHVRLVRHCTPVALFPRCRTCRRNHNTKKRKNKGHGVETSIKRTGQRRTTEGGLQVTRIRKRFGSLKTSCKRSSKRHRIAGLHRA